MANYQNFPKIPKAVVLGYDQDQDLAPKMLVSGSGYLAEQIINIAKASNIPIHQDAQLAETLSVLEINFYIPLEVYGAVAKILSYVYAQESLAKQKNLKS